MYNKIIDDLDISNENCDLWCEAIDSVKNHLSQTDFSCFVINNYIRVGLLQRLVTLLDGNLRFYLYFVFDVNI